MIGIRRTYLWLLMVCFTFSYLLLYVPTPAFTAMLLLIPIGILVAGYALQRKRARWNNTLFFLMLWMLVIQLAQNFLTESFITLMYRTVAGFVSFTLMSSIGAEAAHNIRKSNSFIKTISVFFVAWFLIYIMSVNNQRVAQNWGYANYVYMIFALFPFCFFIKKKLWRHIFVAMLSVAALLSLKRTAIVLLCVYALIYLLEKINVRDKRRSVFLIALIILIAILWTLCFTDAFEQFFEQYLYRFSYAENDDMGGRLEIWRNGLSILNNSNIFDIIFGMKYSYRGRSMHNDYFELLINYGIVGLFLLLTVVWDFWKKYSYIRNAKSDSIKKVWKFSLANFAVLMLVSHVIVYPYMMFICTMPLGYSYGLWLERGE